MIGALAATGVLLVALPGLLERWGARLHPADWARWTAASLVAGAGAIESALLLVAAPTVLRAVGLHGLAGVCARMAPVSAPGGVAVAWTAAAAAVAVLLLAGVAAVGGVRSRRRVAQAAALAPSVEHAGHVVRLVAGDEPVALSVPHRRGGYVVVSEAMVAVLSDDELAAVIRHERAHLRHRHGRFLLVASALDVGLAVHPLIRKATAVLRCALERWADEVAAGPSMRQRALTRAALLAVALGPVPAGVAGFGPVSTIVARVAALERPAPRPSRRARIGAVVSLGLIVAVAFVTAGVAGGQLWAAITMPVTCPLGLG